MKGNQITELKDKSWKDIVPKSCSNYDDYFALDVSKWKSALYKNQAPEESESEEE